MVNSKKNILFFLVVLFMLLSLAIGVVRALSWRSTQMAFAEESIQEKKEYCDSLNGIYNFEAEKNFCNFEETNSTYISFSEFYSVLTDYMPFSSNFILIAVIIIGASYFICSFLKNNLLPYFLTRESFSKVKKKLFISCWKYSLIIPVLFLLKIVICYLITQNIDNPNIPGFWNDETTMSFGVYYLIEIIITFFDCLIYTNIVLLVARKKHNYILTIVISYLVIIGLELFFEVILNGLMGGLLFSTDFGIIFNIISFGEIISSFGCIPPLIFTFIVAVITTIVVILTYKNKEDLLIDCEKNV